MSRANGEGSKASTFNGKAFKTLQRRQASWETLPDTASASGKPAKSSTRKPGSLNRKKG